MAILIPFPTRPEATPTGQVLTPRGEACAHLIRFERAWRTLPPADRRWFATMLRRLTDEAAGREVRLND